MSATKGAPFGRENIMAKQQHFTLVYRITEII